MKSNTKEQRKNSSSSTQNTEKGRKYSKPSNTRRQNKSSKPTDPIDSAGLHKGSRDNDPNWYFSSSELANQAAELSFQSFIGEGTIVGGVEAPTFMAVYLNPSPGVSYSVGTDRQTPGETEVVPNSLDWRSARKDGINLASQKLYTLLSTFSGRTSQYSPADIGTMILAIGEVASISEHLRRFFGLALTYNMRNRAMPIEMMAMLGCSSDDLIKNIADYRMRFNTAMTRINQIPLLDNVGYIRKCRDLYQKIYVDEPSVMAQMYAYVPATTWVIDEDDDEQGSVLKTTAAGFLVNGRSGEQHQQAQLRSMDSWLNLLDSMIDALLSSQTLNLVYADILNLASRMNVPLWQFDYLAEDYVVIPEYDANFLLQLHNLDIIGSPRYIKGTAEHLGREEHGGVGAKFMVTSWNNVYHDGNTGYLLYNPTFTRIAQTADSKIYRDTLVDMLTDTPTIEDKIESLRFSVARSGYHVKVTTQPVGEMTGEVEEEVDVFPAISDHYAVALKMYGNSFVAQPNTIPAWAYQFYYQSNDTVVGTEADSRASFAYAMYSSQFKFAPRMYHFNTELRIDAITGDLDYYTLVDYKYLSRLNRIMYAGLFEFRV